MGYERHGDDRVYVSGTPDQRRITSRSFGYYTPESARSRQIQARAIMNALRGTFLYKLFGKEK